MFKNRLHCISSPTSLLFLLTVFSLVAGTHQLNGQGNRVELEVLVGNDVSIEQRQAWLEVLGKTGADSVRMRSANVGDSIRVTATPFGDRELCKLVGQITGRNQIVLPGGTFGQRDVSGIKALIQRIRDDGAQVALSDKKAFGLIAEQLVDLHKELAIGHNQTTKGVEASSIVSSIGQRLTTPFEISPEGAERLKETYVIEDEMSGLSCGTVLAAVLRPLGLVAMPQRPQGGEIRIVITDSRLAEEHWPIGWPHGNSESRTSPELYRTFSMRVENYGLREVLDAIERKAGVPFIYDYNSFAEKGIELNETEVTLVEEKIAYASAVRKLLRGSRLRIKAEMRVDEAGKPFFWFTTLN